MTQTNSQRSKMVEAGLNLIAQALSIYDQDLRLAACNRRFQEMFDLPRELVSPGASFADTIRLIAARGDYGDLPDLDDFVAQRVAQAQAFQPHYLERRRPNGQIISIEGAPLPQGGWVAVYTDITQTKRAEALLRARSAELSDQLLSHAEELSGTNRKLAASISALEEAKRQLTETEARTRLTTEMMPAHIAHVDAEGCYTFTNGRLADVFPKRPATILGRHMREVLGDHAFARIEPNLAAAYTGQSPVFEFTEDQDRRRLRVAFTPDGQGGVYVLSMDVTEETQARVALQQSRRRALAAQMTSGLAHDFSNLLTIILGMQGKLARMDLPEDAQELVTATLSAADRGGRLLKRLSQVTSQRGLRPEACDVHALLSELKILASPALPRGVGLSVLDNTPDQALLLDPGRLQDALLNLILNARDACGASGQITVAAHLVGQTWLEISVGDTGPGFSQEALEQALNPFFTTKGQEGSGLGLAMVYDMVKSAGGDIRVGNTVSGANVTLRLPYRVAPEVSGRMVLLVEDTPELRETIRELLMALGCAVVEAASLEEATALLADLPDIALVLSDIRLRGSGTGVDLARQIPDDGPPVVLMTSLPPEDPLRQNAARAYPVLPKPFDSKQLSALLMPQARPGAKT
ncbi:Blue-light-activated protein [Tritonibacter multivorans]|uniref:histidine kinase n=1 Tax=Tritonibacter multivorans TaxID=928856 RepID=A0A0P1GCL2_9RHOB|nr:PAS-domain containing protein [Tritonibacter multivorans]MDA7419842.1 PAS-domain containing protein [Tritonibacter multivorans]CUH79203.1 Blue-light-activated protein [Tritonibacter multivorans]SFC15077.1 PAS/PAC sensor hybrid histidine kinase [Tritonibacter multivorans]